MPTAFVGMVRVFPHEPRPLAVTSGAMHGMQKMLSNHAHARPWAWHPKISFVRGYLAQSCPLVV